MRRTQPSRPSLEKRQNHECDYAKKVCGWIHTGEERGKGALSQAMQSKQGSAMQRRGEAPSKAEGPIRANTYSVPHASLLVIDGKGFRDQAHWKTKVKRIMNLQDVSPQHAVLLKHI